MKTKNLFLFLTFTLLLLSCGKGNEVCIYGGSSACVTAAYSAAKMGIDRPIYEMSWSKNYFKHGDLVKGARIVYKMNSMQNTARGTAPEDRPYSFSIAKE
jgi:hypothetical protein